MLKMAARLFLLSDDLRKKKWRADFVRTNDETADWLEQ